MCVFFYFFYFVRSSEIFTLSHTHTLSLSQHTHTHTHTLSQHTHTFSLSLSAHTHTAHRPLFLFMIFTYYAAAYKEDCSVELVEMVEKLLVVKRSPSLALNIYLLLFIIIYYYIYYLLLYLFIE